MATRGIINNKIKDISINDLKTFINEQTENTQEIINKIKTKLKNKLKDNTELNDTNYKLISVDDIRIKDNNISSNTHTIKIQIDISYLNTITQNLTKKTHNFEIQFFYETEGILKDYCQLWFVNSYKNDNLYNKLYEKFNDALKIPMTYTSESLIVNPLSDDFKIMSYSSLGILAYIIIAEKETKEKAEKAEKEKADQNALQEIYNNAKNKNESYIKKIIEYKRIVYSLHTIINDLDKLITNYDYDLRNPSIIDNLKEMNKLIKTKISDANTNPNIPKKFLYYIIKELFVHLLPTFDDNSFQFIKKVNTTTTEMQIEIKESKKKLDTQIEIFLLGFLEKVSEYNNNKISLHRTQLQKFTRKMIDLIGIIQNEFPETKFRIPGYEVEKYGER
jgi:hypothetical protein